MMTSIGLTNKSQHSSMNLQLMNRCWIASSSLGHRGHLKGLWLSFFLIFSAARILPFSIVQYIYIYI